MTTMLDAALDYAWRRWPVLPLRTPTDGRCTCDKDCGSNAGKHQRIADWPNQATTDAATIQQWWRLWPDANLGIATGQASGFFVVDVDPRHGGDDTLRELEARHGALPPTVEALTGGGGAHKLYKYPGPVKSGAGALGRGVDLKADGGCIVPAPSLHASGRRYCWEVSSHHDDVPIAEAPAWLLALLRAETGEGHNERFAVPETIRQGERNSTLYKLARSLKKARGRSFEASHAALQKDKAGFEDRYFAIIQHPDFLLVQVEADHVVFHFRATSARDQPDLSDSCDCDVQAVFFMTRCINMRLADAGIAADLTLICPVDRAARP